MLIPVAALALTQASGTEVAHFADFQQEKAAVAATSEAQSTPAKIRLNVPHKLAYAWASRERDGKTGLVSFYLDEPRALTQLFTLENKAFAGTHGPGTDYYFFRYKDDTATRPSCRWLSRKWTSPPAK